MEINLETTPAATPAPAAAPAATPAPAPAAASEPTPAQRDEILGKTPAEPPAASTPAPDPTKPIDGTPEAKPGETPKAPAPTPPPGTEGEKVFKQSEVEQLIQKRVGKSASEIERLTKENQQFKEHLNTLEARTQLQVPSDPEDQDLGPIFRDPAWNGWTVKKLREAGHENSLRSAEIKLEVIQQRNQERQVEMEAARKQEFARKATAEVDALRKEAPEYFDETGRGNEKYDELHKWMGDNGVWNLGLAHKIRNQDALIAKAKKDAVTEYITGLNTPGLKRMGEGAGTVTPAGSPDTFTDTQLQEAFLVAEPGSAQRADLRNRLVLRGLR